MHDIRDYGYVQKGELHLRTVYAVWKDLCHEAWTSQEELFGFGVRGEGVTGVRMARMGRLVFVERARTLLKCGRSVSDVPRCSGDW